MTLDNGSEFAGRAMEAWPMQVGVQLCFIRPEDPWRMASSKASTGGCGMNVLTSNGSRRSKKRAADWRCGEITTTTGAHTPHWTTGRPQSLPVCTAALDPVRRLSEDIQYQGEALSRIAHSRDSLLSLWSDFQARKTGSGGP